MNLDQILNQKTINRYRDYLKSQNGWKKVIDLKAGGEIAVANENLLPELNLAGNNHQSKSYHHYPKSNTGQIQGIKTDHFTPFSKLKDINKHIIPYPAKTNKEKIEGGLIKAATSQATDMFDKKLDKDFSWDEFRYSSIENNHINWQSIVSIEYAGNHPYLTQDGWQKVIDLKAGGEIAVAEDLLFGTGANSGNQGKGNNNQNVNQASGIEKFNQGTIHNLSSNLDASNIVTRKKIFDIHNELFLSSNNSDAVNPNIANGKFDVNNDSADKNNLSVKFVKIATSKMEGTVPAKIENVTTYES